MLITNYRHFGLWSAVLIIFTATLATAQDNMCKVCHSELQVEFRQSVHAKEGITCVSCHGGNPAATDEEQGHAGDFRPIPSRAQIPAFCAECHADQQQMKPYGIATDQYALYMTSEHGRQLAQGDTSVAVCSDCHGTHLVLAPQDYNSPTNRLNIPATCGHCHANTALMARYSLPADVVDNYESSTHAEAMRQRGNLMAPDCTSCHGSHGAAPPGVGSVDKVCGQCHLRTREFFRLSLHHDLRRAASDVDCGDCHDNHRILVPDAQLWTAACIPCHDASSSEAKTGKKIQTLLTQAGEEIEASGRLIARAEQIPLNVADYQARLATAETYLMESRPVGHALDLASLEETTRKARSIAREVQGEIHSKIRIFEGRKFNLIFFWLYILITIAAIQFYKRAER